MAITLDTEPTSFEVWVTYAGVTQQWRTDLGYATAVFWADGFNQDEAHNALIEDRPVVREFFAVQATTTYKRI